LGLGWLPRNAPQFRLSLRGDGQASLFERVLSAPGGQA